MPAPITTYGAGQLYGASAGNKYGRISSQLISAQAGTHRQTGLLVQILQQNLNNWIEIYSNQVDLNTLFLDKRTGTFQQQSVAGQRMGAATFDWGHRIVRVRIGDGSPADRNIYIQEITDPTDPAEWGDWALYQSGDFYAVAVVSQAPNDTGYDVYAASATQLFKNAAETVDEAGIVEIAPVAGLPNALYIVTAEIDAYDGGVSQQVKYSESFGSDPFSYDYYNYRNLRTQIAAHRRFTSDWVSRIQVGAFFTNPRSVDLAESLIYGKADLVTGYLPVIPPRLIRGFGGQAGYNAFLNPALVYSPTDEFYYLFYTEVRYDASRDLAANLDTVFWQRSSDLEHWSEPIAIGYSNMGGAGLAALESEGYLYLIGYDGVWRRSLSSSVIDISNYTTKATLEIPPTNDQGSAKLSLANPDGINNYLEDLGDRKIQIRPGLLAPVTDGPVDVVEDFSTPAASDWGAGWLIEAGYTTEPGDGTTEASIAGGVGISTIGWPSGRADIGGLAYLSANIQSQLFAKLSMPCMIGRPFRVKVKCKIEEMDDGEIGLIKVVLYEGDENTTNSDELYVVLVKGAAVGDLNRLGIEDTPTIGPGVLLTNDFGILGYDNIEWNAPVKSVWIPGTPPSDEYFWIELYRNVDEKKTECRYWLDADPRPDSPQLELPNLGSLGDLAGMYILHGSAWLALSDVDGEDPQAPSSRTATFAEISIRQEVSSWQFADLNDWWIDRIRRVMEGAAHRMELTAYDFSKRLANPLRDIYSFIGQTIWRDWNYPAAGYSTQNQLFNYFIDGATPQLGDVATVELHNITDTAVMLWTGWKGHSFRLDIYFSTGADYVADLNQGIVYGRASADNYYWVRFGGGYLTLSRFVQGVETVLGGSEFGYPDSFHLIVEKKFGWHLIYINYAENGWTDELILQVLETDPLVEPGYVGVMVQPHDGIGPVIAWIQDWTFTSWETPYSSQDLIKTALAMADIHNPIVTGAEDNQLAVVWGPQTNYPDPLSALKDIFEQHKLDMAWRNGQIHVGQFKAQSIIRSFINNVVKFELTQENGQRLNLVVVDGNEDTYLAIDASDSRSRGTQVVGYFDLPELTSHAAVVSRAEEELRNGVTASEYAGTAPLQFDVWRLDGTTWYDLSGTAFNLRVVGITIELDQGLKPIQRAVYKLVPLQ